MYRSSSNPGANPKPFIKGNKPLTLPLTPSVNPDHDWWQADHSTRQAIISPYAREEYKRVWEEVDKGHLIPTKIVPREDYQMREALSENCVSEPDDDFVWMCQVPAVRKEYEDLWDQWWEVRKMKEKWIKVRQDTVLRQEWVKVEQARRAENNAMRQEEVLKFDLDVKTRELNIVAKGEPQKPRGKQFVKDRIEERIARPTIASIPTALVPGRFPRALTPAELAITNPPEKQKPVATTATIVSQQQPAKSPEQQRRAFKVQHPPPAPQRRLDSVMAAHSPQPFHGVYREPSCTSR